METISGDEFKKKYGVTGVSQFQASQPAQGQDWFAGKKFGDRPNGSYLKDVGQEIKSGYDSAIEGIQKPSQLPTTPSTKDYLRAGLRGVGGIAKAAVAPITSFFKPMFEPVAAKAMENPTINKVSTTLSELAKKHPESAKDIEDVINIVTLGLSEKAGNAVETNVKTEASELGAARKGLLEEKPAIAVPEPIKAPEIAPTKNPISVAHEAITPTARELTPTEYKELLSRGRVSPKTATEPAKYILSDSEKALGQKYQNLLQHGDPVKNGDAILKEIVSKDSAVEQYLKTKTTEIWSKPRFKKYLSEKLGTIRDITIPDERLNTAKNDLINTFVDKLPKNATLEDLWRARKQFDAAVDQRLKAFDGAPSLKKDLARQLRNGIQDFIAESTGEKVYSGYMKDMSELYDLGDVVWTKGMKEKGLNSIKAWMVANPAKAKTARWVLGTIGLGAAAKVL